MIDSGQLARLWAGLAIVGLLGFTACGDDSDDSTATSDNGESAASDDVTAAFCDARVATEAAFIAEDVDAAQSALVDLEASAPASLAEDVATVSAGLSEDPEAAFEDPEFLAAIGAINEVVLDGCGFEVVEVTGVDYAYQGLPESIATGTVAFQFTNGSDDEFHEIGIVRVDDDVTLSTEELLDLPEEEVDQMVTFVGGAFAGPGESDVTIADLEPGRYVAACFIPEGASPENDFEGTGPPHAHLGMVNEFTVN